jgi:hypothetical protein
MIRPWMGAVIAVLAVALLPGMALAQEPADTTPPTISLVTPGDGATYTVGQTVLASYSCVDASGIADCTGPVGNGQEIDTTRAGDFVFTITAHDRAGNANNASAAYKIVVADSDPGPVDGGGAPTLTLTLGSAPAFAPFTPGQPQTYSASMTATVLSTAGDALRTAADPSAIAPGHLLNGTTAMPQPLSASASSAIGTSAPEAPIGDTANPTSLLTYGGPVTNDQVTLTFKQAIGATDALRTGSYAKTFVFTLSTTRP